MYHSPALLQLMRDIEAEPDIIKNYNKDIIDNLKERTRGRSPNYLTLDDLDYIAKLKSVNGRNTWISLNSEMTIINSTLRAFSAPNATAAMEALLYPKLIGVKVPTASAVLAWMYPERYGVIDVRAWQQLTVYGLTERFTQHGMGLNIKHWTRYHDILTDVADELDVTPQYVDLWLYNKHVLEQAKKLEASGRKPRANLFTTCR